jgi:hypothetical protein
MVRAGIVLVLVGALLVAGGSLLYGRVLTVPQLSPQVTQSISWLSWALGGVFVTSGAGAVLSDRKRRRGPT